MDEPVSDSPAFSHTGLHGQTNLDAGVTGVALLDVLQLLLRKPGKERYSAKRLGYHRIMHRLTSLEYRWTNWMATESSPAPG